MEYCERTFDGLWAEPLNALTNLAIIIAGLVLLRILVRRGASTVPWEVPLLILLVFSIGVGSGLWHTLATPWSEMADVLPILLYINIFLVSYLARVARVSLWQGLGLFLLFHALNVGLLSALPPGTLNGSIFYVPAWLTLVLMALHTRAIGDPGSGLLAGATGLFTLSLVFRTVDNAVCAAVPTGTHFLWHLLNGVVLYLSTRFLMVPARAGQSRGRLPAWEQTGP